MQGTTRATMTSVVQKIDHEMKFWTNFWLSEFFSQRLMIPQKQ